MIRGYHIYMDVWLSYTGEVLYCCLDERSVEGTAVRQNRNVYSLEFDHDRSNFDAY